MLSLAISVTLIVILFGNSIVNGSPEIYSPSDGTLYLTPWSQLYLKCKEPQGYAIEWLFNGLKVSSSVETGFMMLSRVKENSVAFSDLLKEHVDENDGGDYSCKTPSGRYTVSVIIVKALVGHVVTVEEPRDKAVLNCTVDYRKYTFTKIEWFRNNKRLISSDSTQYTGNPITIHTVGYPDDLGDYKCSVLLSNGGQLNATVKLEGKPFIKAFPQSMQVYDQDNLTIECSPLGLPPPEVKWMKDGYELSPETDERVIFLTVANINASTLVLVNATYKDRATYTCFASNTHGNMSQEVLVRVKGNLNALWPLMGITLEVVVLLSVIFPYERYHRKRLKDSDSSSAPLESQSAKNSSAEAPRKAKLQKEE